MANYNNSLWYYKRYYADQGDEYIKWEVGGKNDANEKIFQRRNKALFASLFPIEQALPWAYPTSGLTTIDLLTTYPGLLLGSGIAHGTGQLGELKLGFFFDHTTGLPVIAGSSVKGVLRSVFPAAYTAKRKKAKDKKKRGLDKVPQLLQLLQYYLRTITKQDWPAQAVNALEDFLFGTFEPGDAKAPHPGRIIFHDAIPLNAERVQLNQRATRRYLADDYITPHKSKDPDKIPHALVNPVPVAFLKVLPGVTFRFQFRLQTFTYTSEEAQKRTLTEDQISQLFELILLDMGTGAKTNVGYGRWAQANAQKTGQRAHREEEKQRDKALVSIASNRSGNRRSQQQTHTGKRQPPRKPTPPKPSKEAGILPGKYIHPKPLTAGQILTARVVKGSKKYPEKQRFAFRNEDKVYYLADERAQQFQLGELVNCAIVPSKSGAEAAKIMTDSALKSIINT